MCEKSQKIRFFGSILYLANLKVTVAKYRLLSVRFEFITRKLCKNKCMKNYTQKSREKIACPAVQFNYFIIKKYSCLSVLYGIFDDRCLRSENE